jgi:hypothetical protein
MKSFIFLKEKDFLANQNNKEKMNGGGGGGGNGGNNGPWVINNKYYNG